MKRPTRILYAVLDWGLGHAGRSIPVIRALQGLGADVRLASAGDALALLRRECPDLPMLELPPYRIRYGTNSMYVNLGWQWPRMMAAALRENLIIRKAIAEQAVDLIISDCRFGCFHPRVRSIWLGHQLQVRGVRGWGGNSLYHAYLRQTFSEIWIPDYGDEQYCLSGELSRPPRGFDVHHLGWLSRFANGSMPPSGAYPIVALLSGPEPQRSRLEARLKAQLADLPGPSLLIRGLPKSKESTVQAVNDRLSTIDVLHGTALHNTLAAAEVVICRSGYSSVMDLAMLGKHALFIPTPGQTEQEYLARFYQERGWAPYQKQHELDVASGLERARAMQGLPRPPGEVGLEERLKGLIRLA